MPSTNNVQALDAYFSIEKKSLVESSYFTSLRVLCELEELLEILKLFRPTDPDVEIFVTLREKSYTRGPIRGPPCHPLSYAYVNKSTQHQIAFSHELIKEIQAPWLRDVRGNPVSP